MIGRRITGWLATLCSFSPRTPSRTVHLRVTQGIDPAMILRRFVTPAPSPEMAWKRSYKIAFASGLETFWPSPETNQEALREWAWDEACSKFEVFCECYPPAEWPDPIAKAEADLAEIEHNRSISE